MFAVLPLFFVLLLPLTSYGASTEEYNKIQERMNEQKKKLSEVQQREHSILKDIEDVNIKLGTIESELLRYRKNLGKTENEIARVNADISKTSASIDRQKNWLRRKLRTIHRYGYSGDTVTLLMSSTDIAQAMRTVKYLESISRHEHRLLLEYKNSIVKLNADRAKLQTLRAELKNHTEKIKSKEGELAVKRKSKEVILNSVRQEKAASQKMLAELKDASRKMLAIIRESSRSESYTASGFGKLKGRLLWPVDGRIAVPYGSQRDPQFDTPIFRNGVHIKTNPSADIRAVYSGKVIFAEWFKGFGQLLIVNHGGSYHTLYGNLSEIFSKVGDIIKDKQVIGKAGTSGVMDSPGLYFEIRYKGKPLDPAQWLKSRRN